MWHIYKETGHDSPNTGAAISGSLEKMMRMTAT
jgi:hypothetical protein